MPDHRFIPALILLLAVSACGPSLRRVHRGDVYFERCYSADRDPLVPTVERRACWQAWYDHYQDDQPPERLDFVRERLLMLRPGNAAVLALTSGTPGELDSEEEEATTPSAEPQPAQNPPALAITTAPEPPVLEPAAVRRQARPMTMPASTNTHCTEACRPQWEECVARCSPDARIACGRACRLELRTCSRSCY